MNNNYILNTLKNRELEKKLLSFETIGERLKYLREEYAKIPPTSFARQLGITKAMEHKYENNQFIPKIERLREFAAFYDIPEEYITGESADMLLKEDYFVISNLVMFCWLIENGKILVILPELIHESLAEGVIYLINNINLSDAPFSLKEYLNSLSEEVNQKNLVNINECDLSKMKITHLIRIIDLFINTYDRLTKKQFIMLNDILRPLLNLYTQYLTFE